MFTFDAYYNFDFLSYNFLHAYNKTREQWFENRPGVWHWKSIKCNAQGIYCVMCILRTGSAR